MVIVERDLGVASLRYWSTQVRAALGLYGVDVRAIDGKATPSGWRRAMQIAVDVKPDIIILNGVEPAPIAEQVGAAQRAAIPVISTHAPPQRSATAPAVAGVAADVSADQRALGERLADWFIADSKGTGNAVVFSSNSLPFGSIRLRSLTGEITRRCPACKYLVRNAPRSTWFDGRLAATAAALLAADPGVCHFLAVHDEMTLLGLDPAVVASGRPVRVGGINGTLAVLNSIKAGTPTVVTVAVADDWFAMSVADAAFRLLTGRSVPSDYRVGFRAVSSTSLGSQPYRTNTELFGFDALVEFQNIWGPPA